MRQTTKISGIHLVSFSWCFGWWLFKGKAYATCSTPTLCLLLPAFSYPVEASPCDHNHPQGPQYQSEVRQTWSLSHMHGYYLISMSNFISPWTNFALYLIFTMALTLAGPWSCGHPVGRSLTDHFIEQTRTNMSKPGQRPATAVGDECHFMRT